jgi:LysR family transcriptional regulator, chromosome initiation inhibitor
MLNLDLQRLEALAAAISEGTFDAAAGKLHVTPSAISQRVKALETSIGCVLLTRSKLIRPTPSGTTLLQAARQIQAITADAVRELGVSTTGNAPVFPLAVNADSLATWLLPALATAGPDLVFDLRREGQERTAQLLRDGVVMAAVTASPDPIAGCTAERLAVATACRTATCAGAPAATSTRPRHHVPGSDAFVQAVRLGLGWGWFLTCRHRRVTEGCPTSIRTAAST